MMPPFIRLTYGELLQLFRKRNHLTLTAVAEKIGTTPKTLKNYEEDITFPSFRIYKRLNELYGEEFSELAEYTASKSQLGEKHKFRLKTPTVLRFFGSLSKVKSFHISPQLLKKLMN